MKGNHLSLEKKVQILNMLCEGSSMRSVSRVVGCSINTVTKLLVDTGELCGMIHNEHLRNLAAKQIQVDEIWSFCYGKSTKVSPDKGGDIWTYTAVDPESRLVVAWRVGDRSLQTCRQFCWDLSQRVTGRPQITSDGLHIYEQCLEAAFGDRMHYGQLVKNYANNTFDMHKATIRGNPDHAKISTSHVERQNLSMRMGMRRYTRKTNAHSKKIDNHLAALNIYFCFQNFIRVNSKLRVTPAMEAGVADSVWTWEEVLTSAHLQPAAARA